MSNQIISFYDTDQMLAPGEELVYRQDLAYQSGSSDKVYIIIVSRTSTGKYAVRGHYGRRGGSLAKTVIDLKESASLGTAAALKMSQSKVQKGYQILGGVENEHYHQARLSDAVVHEIFTKYASGVTIVSPKTGVTGVIDSHDSARRSAVVKVGNGTFVEVRLTDLLHYEVVK